MGYRNLAENKEVTSVLALILFIGSISAIMYQEKSFQDSIQQEEITVEQVLVVNGTNGTAVIEPDLPSDNLVGDSYSNSWKFKVREGDNVNVTFEVSDSAAKDYFTGESADYGFDLSVGKEGLPNRDSNYTLTFDDTEELKLSGESYITLELENTDIPLNYDVEDAGNFEIRIDAEGAELT